MQCMDCAFKSMKKFTSGISCSLYKFTIPAD
jgi:hypothetical protein